MNQTQKIAESFDSAIRKLQAEKEQAIKAEAVENETLKTRQTSQMEIIFTKKEVAEMLKFSQKKIDRLVKAGVLAKIPSKPGTAVRFRESEIKRFIGGETNEHV